MSGSGRAARAEVERRLETARRGAELLDRKQQILRIAISNRKEKAEQSRLAWEQAARNAALWLSRTLAMDGLGRVHGAVPESYAKAGIVWGGAMGIRYPEGASVTLPAPVPPAGSSALAFAAAAHREALAAAVIHAADARALLLVSRELAETRTRQRAVENRWIPRLEAELERIQRSLAEQELEESLRLRWAAGAV
ncbi:MULTISPECIES: V-type ATP synthase subunit D [Arthrobacter]|uniref:V-type ATP synthase subunit D n=1 Tax=Arthrobacter TaxID=1663 RepID=UPI001D14E7E5|nr:V-type ATP synthase subunit D [Arthrobacter caoxuetaonis]MCC9193262.1 V-type ATP synthase subunit D [Arthrobacter sp. zg-Y916]